MFCFFGEGFGVVWRSRGSVFIFGKRFFFFFVGIFMFVVFGWWVVGSEGGGFENKFGGSSWD